MSWPGGARRMNLNGVDDGVPAKATLVCIFATGRCREWNAMEIEDLKTFVEIADSGDISTAARRLGRLNANWIPPTTSRFRGGGPCSSYWCRHRNRARCP